MKVVINKCYGGFGINRTGVEWIRKNAPCAHVETLDGERYSDGSGPRVGYSFGVDCFGHDDAEARSCPSLVAMVEAIGDKGNGSCAKLRVVEIPDGTAFVVDDYDGMERIAERATGSGLDGVRQEGRCAMSQWCNCGHGARTHGATGCKICAESCLPCLAFRPFAKKGGEALMAHKAEGHHFCITAEDEYSRCCKCGAQAGYRLILDGPCVNQVDSAQTER